jgi:hypothetical protein
MLILGYGSAFDASAACAKKSKNRARQPHLNNDLSAGILERQRRAKSCRRPLAASDPCAFRFYGRDVSAHRAKNTEAFVESLREKLRGCGFVAVTSVSLF